MIQLIGKPYDFCPSECEHIKLSMKDEPIYFDDGGLYKINKIVICDHAHACRMWNGRESIKKEEKPVKKEKTAHWNIVSETIETKQNHIIFNRVITCSNCHGTTKSYNLENTLPDVCSRCSATMSNEKKEIKTAKWVFNSYPGSATCSKCGLKYIVLSGFNSIPNYCPRCLSEMSL